VKIWIRIIVAVSVILVVGFAIWAFCFREKDEVQAYNRTAELVDYKQSLGINEKLVDLRKINYLANNKDNIIGNETDVEKKIQEYRSLCFGEDVITNSGEITYYSYLIMDQYVNELLEYYLPYTKSNTAKSKPLKALKENIDKYIKSLKELNESLERVIAYQTAIQGNETELEILKEHYINLHKEYRESLNCASTVVISLVNYIDVSVYSDDIKIDVTFALNDAFVRSLQVATNIELILEPEYLHDVKVIKDVISKFEDGQNIFTEQYKEIDFVQSYNTLYNNYTDTLNYIYSCKNLEKQQMAEGVSLSNVIEKVQTHVVNILNVIGF